MTRLDRLRTLDPLLAPRSIAVVGASNEPTRIGGRPLQHLIARGFAGPIYPINPNRESVQGLRAYPTVAAMPTAVDCAVVAVPAEQVMANLEACAARGVRGIVLFSSGFAEMGSPAGHARQAELAGFVQRTGIRILGPNCLGCFNAEVDAHTTFTAPIADGIPVGGDIAVVSQSGAYASHMLQLAGWRGIPFRHWLCTGNEVDVEVGDGLAWLAERPKVRLIILYIEGIRSGARLIDGLARARRNGKFVVATKVGRTEIGAAAAASHTASLAGSDAVYGAVFRKFGVHRAESCEEILDIAYAMRVGRMPRGRRLCILSTSGGVGVQMADAAVEQGLALPELPPSDQAALLKVIPYASPRNPIDMSGQVANQSELIGVNLRIALASGQYDSVALFMSMVASWPHMVGAIRAALAEAKRDHPDRTVVMAILAKADVIAQYEAEGVPVFDEAMRAIRCLTALSALGAAARLVESPAVPAPRVVLPAGRAPNEDDAKVLLETIGLRRPRERLVRDAEQAAAAAQEIGGAVCVKIVSADIAHKTEVGGVALGLAGPAAAAAAVGAMAAAIPARLPGARIDGFLVSEMVAGGTEVILGLRRDPVFGPVVLLGLGGIFVEVLKDVALRIAPVDAAEARAMIDELRGVALLKGARGQQPADIEALAQAVVAVSRLGGEARLGGLEVNPLRVLPAGQGVVVLDALIELAGEAH
jgi:acyl-CoA synthetase (NDP forming)